MSIIVRTADSKGRVVLPGFANATLIIEAVSDNEYRVRKARVMPKDELRFAEEEGPLALSERDALMIAGMLENPPKPNATAKKAAKRHRKQHG